jgi:ubiquinone/menaquinone biosynthesis C-methylase UbiE
MLARAARRAETAGRAVDLRVMDVTSLAFPAAAFDAAVSSFLFCVLPEELQEAALREIARVLKPGGTLRLLEYTRPTNPLRAFVARLWEPWMAFAFGAGFDRRTEEHARAIGLTIVRSRFVVADLIKLIDAKP